MHPSKERMQDAPFADIPNVIEAIRAGEMVVVTDDEGRENEGDLICAAEKATAQEINFMISRGRGLICVAMERNDLVRLGLSRMTRRGGGDPLKTAFMESVDAKEGISTGISAGDRARTVQVMVDDQSSPADLESPGHMFPLEAVEGGVLRRAGHTEAAVDLARLAGLKPAGVICEVVRDDGQMARLPDLIAFSREHGLKLASMADLLAYRRHNELLVRKEGETSMPTEWGTFQLSMYYSLLDGEHHLALVMGRRPDKEESPLVRVHSECFTGDVLGSLRCDCGSQLRESLQMVAAKGSGAVLYMRQEGRGIGLAHKIHAYALQDKGLDTVEANKELGFEPDLRDYGISAQMLKDLGMNSIRLITNNPEKIAGLERYGIKVVGRVPLILPITAHNEKYLETKKSKLGHLL